VTTETILAEAADYLQPANTQNAINTQETRAHSGSRPCRV